MNIIPEAQAWKKYMFTEIQKISEGFDMRGIGIFFFGSPSRMEMLGDSDLDILVVRDKDSQRSRQFYTYFNEQLKKYSYTKLDIPVWGTLEDCERYLSTSIPEGNQIMESVFVCGDVAVEKSIDEIKKKYITRDRLRKIIAFQYLYFEQYYKQRSKRNAKNLKYGHGGTRDLMFVTWMNQFLNGGTLIDRPAIIEAMDGLGLHD